MKFCGFSRRPSRSKSELNAKWGLNARIANAANAANASCELLMQAVGRSEPFSYVATVKHYLDVLWGLAESA